MINAYSACSRGVVPVVRSPAGRRRGRSPPRTSPRSNGFRRPAFPPTAVTSRMRANHRLGRRTRASTRFMILDLQGDPAKPLVLLSGEKGGPSPSWSPDGRWLYFISGKSGSAQVWRSTARRLGSAAADRPSRSTSPAFKLAPDHAHVVRRRRRLSRLRDAGLHQGARRRESQGKGQRNRDQVGTAALFRFLSRRQIPGPVPRRPQPARLAGRRKARLVNGISLPMSRPTGISNPLPSSSDGRTVYFASCDPAVDPVGQAFARIYAVPADGSAPPRVLVERARHFVRLAGHFARREAASPIWPRPRRCSPSAGPPSC